MRRRLNLKDHSVGHNALKIDQIFGVSPRRECSSSLHKEYELRNYNEQVTKTNRQHSSLKIKKPGIGAHNILNISSVHKTSNVRIQTNHAIWMTTLKLIKFQLWGRREIADGTLNIFARKFWWRAFSEFLSLLFLSFQKVSLHRFLIQRNQFWFLKAVWIICVPLAQFLFHLRNG
jgi:hypothetical protein